MKLFLSKLLAYVLSICYILGGLYSLNHPEAVWVNNLAHVFIAVITAISLAGTVALFFSHKERTKHRQRMADLKIGMIENGFRQTLFVLALLVTAALGWYFIFILGLFCKLTGYSVMTMKEDDQ